MSQSPTDTVEQYLGGLAMTSGTEMRFIIDLEKGKPTCQLGKALETVRPLGLRLEICEP